MNARTSTRTAVVTLPSDTEIVITREFNAPKHLVYAAWTTPELVKRWWSGGMGETTVAEIDLRVGGRWRYAMTVPGGEVAFHGEYREIVPNERIVNTEIYEDGAELDDTDPVLNTVTFTEADGRTTVRLLVTTPDKQTRDAIVESGMEEGLQNGWDILEQIAVSLT